MTGPAEQVTVVAHLTAKPGKQFDLLKLMRGLLEPTRKEVGCIRYELNQEIKNPLAFTFAEKFTSRHAYTAHLKMRHIKQFAEQSIDMVDGRRVRMHRELLPIAGTSSAMPESDETQIVVMPNLRRNPARRRNCRRFCKHW